jgi:hypothetical protein
MKQVLLFIYSLLYYLPFRSKLALSCHSSPTEYFKHAAHTLFFSSKCRLFHNATFFGSCIIHILHTECAKKETYTFHL